MLGSNKFLQFSGAFLAFGFTILQGVDWLFKKYSIDNKYFNFLLALLVLSFLGSLFFLFFKKNKSDKSKVGEPKKGKYIKIANVVITSLLLFLFIYFFRKSNSKEILINDLLPKISSAYDKGDIYYVFKTSKELLKEYPNNKILNDFLEMSSWVINVDSDLPNTDVYIKYGRDSTWNYLGIAPMDSIHVPGLGEENDFNLKLISGDVEYIGEDEQKGMFNLSYLERLPENFILKNANVNQPMVFPGLFFGSNISWDAFGISRFEVSNIEFKEFLDQGGYENPEFWDFPIVIEGKEYTYKNTIGRFTDKFGKFGPGNWRYGQYPKGEENYPVSNISWFEASAFARFKGLKLPNVFQWLHAANLHGFNIGKLPNLEKVNLNSDKLVDVFYEPDSLKLLPNIAGNVREWVTNPDSDFNYSALGGSYNEPTYSFSSYYSLSPFARTAENGFRLVKSFSEKDKKQDKITIKYDKNYIRDFDKEENVSDEIFLYYKSQFDFEDYPMEVLLEDIQTPEKGYKIERFEMDTPYKSDEKLFGFIIYSLKFKDYLKPIIDHPSAGALFDKTTNWLKKYSIRDNKFLLDEGYAVILPVYHSTLSRKRTIDSWWPNKSEEYKQSILKIGKDFKRVIDYIESRKEFDISKLSYQGYSWGSVSSNYLLAIDDRVKSAAIFVGGLMLQKSKKEIEPHIYLRRIKIPVLHIVGKSDGVFDHEKSFKPWNKLIGTPAKDKKIVILENIGHGLPKDTIIKYQLELLKKYN